MKVTTTLLAIAGLCLATPSPRIGDFIGFGKDSLAPQVSVIINNREAVKVTLRDGQGSVELKPDDGRTPFKRINSANIEYGPTGAECLFTATQEAPASPQLTARFGRWGPYATMFSADGLTCFIPSPKVVRVMVTPLVEKDSLLAVELGPGGHGETRIGREGKTYSIKNAVVVDGPSVACSIIYERSDSRGQGQYMQSTFTNTRQFYGNVRKAFELHCERRAARSNLLYFGNN